MLPKINQHWPEVNCENRDIADNGNSEISFTVLTPSHFCTCPKPAPGFPSAYYGIFVFNNLK